MAESNAMRKTVTILDVETRTAKKSGKPYRVAQCIVHGDKIKVGEMMIFGADIVCEKGEFFADFEVDVNFDRQVSANLVRLMPVNGRPVSQVAKPA